MSIVNAFELVKERVLKFENEESFFLSTDYNETEVRQSFINPFFKALGWDVDSLNSTDVFSREVRVEKGQKQNESSSKKRADYAFYCTPNYKEGQEVFFVEAKKPSRVLNQNKDDYFQTANYGFYSRTGISILFDFQEFIIIDCRVKPDKAVILQHQIKYYNYKQFLDFGTFTEIYNIFSRDAVHKGNLQRYIESLPPPKISGKSRQMYLNFGFKKNIDNEFLNFIEQSRKDLAEAIFHCQPTLKGYELTEAVQKILDRLVFFRFLEDKNIEPDSIIDAIWNSTSPWAKFVEESRRLDTKYNSGVFSKSFFDEPKFLAKDNKLFKDIVVDYSTNESDYNFNYIPIEIIGNIYERFLGKTIEVEGKHLKIDYKPSVRKAGGVYYTPTYIVNYIVQNTVGKLIEGKTPKQISSLSFADISCGSGSFLIGIFEYLIKYHTLYYNAHRDQAIKDRCHYDEDDKFYYLAIEQKKSILLNNIYGVDLDRQATIVAQMSLLLKLLENETFFTTTKGKGAQVSMMVADKILPNLSENIKSGNSLIGSDYTFQTELNFDDDGELERKINVFDFEPSFPRVFRNGGFDAIVGNPPYVGIIGLSDGSNDEAKKYYSEKYKTAFKGYDLYVLFFEAALRKLNLKGLLGYITPNKFATLDYGLKLRKLIIEDKSILEITDLSNLNIFPSASVYPYITIIENKKPLKEHIIQVKKCKIESDLVELEFNQLNQLSLLSNNSLNISLNKKVILPKNYRVLADVCKVQAGTTGFLATITKECIEDNISEGLEFIVTGSIDRYEVKLGNIRYINKKFTRPKLINKDNKITKGKWDLFSNKKIVIGGMTKFLEAYLDEKGYAVGVGVYCLNDFKINEKVLLALINSTYTTYYFRSEFEAKHLAGGYLAINVGQLCNIPIPKEITKENEIELIKLVDKMIDLKQKHATTLSDNSKESIANQIKSTDYYIDKLVYELYDLTEDEKKIIEN